VLSSITEPLHSLAERWANVLRPSRRRIAAALVVLAWAFALLLARRGTPRARLCAGAAALASAVAAGAWEGIARRRARAPQRLLRGAGRRVDAARVDRALRALAFVGPDGEIRADGVSIDLARLHVGRALAQLPSGPILESGARLAGRTNAAAAIVAVAVVGLVATRPWSVLEGGDVLLARAGVAPIEMTWLDQVELSARPPEYLHQSEIHEIAMTALALPYGTSISVRGEPQHTGRNLLLSDGTTEVPFVEDGAGAVVARWSLTQSGTLRVVARFGDVVIPQAQALPLTSVPDDAPVVRLDGAPRRVRLVEEVEDIPIKYEASDDHGLREVHLVLRCGAREERRVLARLDGETRTDAGGQILKLRDPFLRKNHAPVEVTVEAKDNDPLSGPKWGASEAITVVPPDVGEPEARRLDALRKLRDELVDTLAWRLEVDPNANPADRSAFVAEEGRRTVEDEQLLDRTLSEAYAGIRVPARTRAMLLAQRQNTRKAVDVELRAPGAGSHAEVVKATERAVLVIDAIVRGLGIRDSRDSARQLADVADDLAAGAYGLESSAEDATSPNARARNTERMDVSTSVLAAGGRVMMRLGALGRDLGEIVEADLPRVRRARDASDFAHAELAARDLAARLRQPDPSFGARGSGGRAGGESGGARGTPGDDEQPPDDVEQAFDEAASDLEKLSSDHAGEMNKMEQALAGATSEEELNQMREEAKRHAEAIRDAVRSLPAVGMGSDSWTSKGAAARELAEQTARSLEQGRTEEASQSGRGAIGSLDDAKRLLRGAGSFDDPSGQGERRVEEARRKLESESKWIADELRELRKRAAARARDQLERGGGEEGQLADRARELGQKGRDKGSLPQQAIDSIEDAERAARQAADALKEGDADKGLERQREAQRSLEAAREQLQGEDEGNGSPTTSGSEGKQPSPGHVDVPDDYKGPEEFRRRVVRGLGQAGSGSLRDAVQRYAEGLLR
jgi:DNA-binding NarL/FixJ family response regulator